MRQLSGYLSFGRSPLIRSSILAASALAGAMLLSGCGSDPAAASKQIGPNPPLPAINQYLLPPMKIAPTAKWDQGETPTAAPGLKVQALATGLMHPRQPYVLPNGDILVTEANGPGYEPITRPKDLVMGWVQSFAGAGAKGGNRITLIRDADGDGVPELKTVLIDGLVSPFGMALIGNNLYVANTDAIVRYPYSPGQTKITAPGQILTRLPGPPIDHHWTKSLLASPDGKTLYVGVGSNSNITENGIGAEANRAAVWQVDVATGAHRIYASGPAQSQRPQLGTADGQAMGRRQRARRDWAEPSPRLYDVGAAGRLLWLAVQLLGTTRRSARDAAAARPGEDRNHARLFAEQPCRAARSRLLHWRAACPRNTTAARSWREHGSWDRDPFNGYRVVYVPFANGRPAGHTQDVLTGFLDKSGGARGRPVALAVDRTGALIVADDLGDTVWRVSGARRAATDGGALIGAGLERLISAPSSRT